MQIKTKEYSVRSFEHLRHEELGQLDVFDRFVPGSLWNFTAFKGAFITTSGMSDEEFFGTTFIYLNRGVRDITKFFQFSLKNISFLEVDPDSPIVILDKYLVVDNTKQKVLTEWNFDGSHVLLMNAVVAMKVLHKETFAFAKMNIQILLGKKEEKDWEPITEEVAKFRKKGWEVCPAIVLDFWKPLVSDMIPSKNGTEDCPQKGTSVYMTNT